MVAKDEAKRMISTARLRPAYTKTTTFSTCNTRTHLNGVANNVIDRTCASTIISSSAPVR